MIHGQTKLIECPRDAMQGWGQFIPTQIKIAYLNSLLQVGFHTLDFGSFVSPKAIPQLADTAEVLAELDLTQTPTKLLAIVANFRGAEAAVFSPKITYLGFPLSVSETFQQRNTNASIPDAIKLVAQMQALCVAQGKSLVVYLSMGFGNPYGDAYSPELVLDYAKELATIGIQTISLADTVGMAAPDQIYILTQKLISQLPQTEIGVHLHATAEGWQEKIDAAYTAGCRRFDGALKGIGGCPMSGSSLVGNINTEWLLQYLQTNEPGFSVNDEALQKSLQRAEQIFV